MSKSRTGTTAKKTTDGVPDAYYNELVATFQLHSAKESDTLSLHSLQRAMRTLGFDASIDDLLEIVDNTPTLSLHKGKKSKKMARRSKGKGTTTETSSQARRRSSGRTGQKSKYVDSDEGESGGDNDDEEEEEEEDEYGVDGDEYYFTLQDFIALMGPSEVSFLLSFVHAWMWVCPFCYVD